MFHFSSKCKIFLFVFALKLQTTFLLWAACDIQLWTSVPVTRLSVYFILLYRENWHLFHCSRFDLRPSNTTRVSCTKSAIVESGWTTCFAGRYALSFRWRLKVSTRVVNWLDHLLHRPALVLIFDVRIGRGAVIVILATGWTTCYFSVCYWPLIRI